MPERIKLKMNGVVPSVPITTLAGIASLSDLLPEMPLPTPLPQTLTNKSLLFHPRVAEEAKILLSLRDESLVPQLIMSLSQTSSEHIELKDNYPNTEQSLENEQNTPELLKTILRINPDVFRGTQHNSPRNWTQGAPMLHANQSPASYGRFSPSYSSSSGSRQTPQGSPAQTAAARSVLPSQTVSSGIALMQHQQMPITSQNHADISQMSPFTVPSSSPRGNVMTEQTSFQTNRTLTTPQHIQEDSTCMNPLSNVTLQPNMYSSAHMSSPNASLTSLTNMTPQHDMAGMTSQHNMHMTSPMRNVPLQQHPAMGMQQNLYDSMMNQQVHHALGSGQSLDIDNAVQENQQFLLDPVAGLSDIDLPIENIDTKQSVDHAIQHLLPTSQTTSYPNIHATDMVNVLDPAAASMASNVQHQQNNNSEKSMKLSGAEKMKEPIVMLNRLSKADQALMQKSLAAFAEKSPSRAAKMGISNRDDASKTDSESEEEIGKNNKYFKARAKERQVQREKEKAERRKSEDKGRRRKRITDDDEEDDVSYSSTKPKIRKIEKKLVPVLAKLSVEELMETNTYQRFNSTIETIFENTEDITANADLEDDGEVLPEMLIPKYQLHDLCTEAAKLKTLGAMESIPTDKLVRLLNILEKNIRDGARVSPLVDPDDDVDEGRLWMQLAMERVQRAVEASLIALHIMTSSNMPKTVYLEDVIDRIVLFMKFQLQNTIYPSFDPVYKVDTKNKTDNFNSSGRKKRGHTKEVREKSILQVYNKMHELVGLLAELLNIQVLTDTSVLHASSLGVAPFFVESVSDLQLSALKLVTVIFTKYEKHRRLLLDDILASIARLPSSKRSLRTYRLNSEDYIQMLTALVLQLIQCVVVLSDSKSKEDDEKKPSHVDADVFIITRYETATRIAGNFLTVFLNKCGSKGEEIDYRPLFENFVQDLLATVNKPEWPAAELLLSLLGNLLVGHFSNKSSDMSLRVASIDYLGVVAARLRKDAVSSQCKLSTIDQIIRDIKLEQQKDSDYDQIKDKEIVGLSEDEERTVFLQKVLLDYLAVNGTKDPALGYARHFYLAQWYRDCAMEKSRVGQSKNSPSKKMHKKRAKKKNRHHSSDQDTESELDEQDPDENDNNEQKNSEAYRIIEEKKKYFVSRIKPYSTGTKPDILQTYIDYNSAELISQYLASKRPFSQSFDRYLKQILHVLTESSIAIRTKAMKCLTMIVEADPSVLARVDMQLGVKHSFLDHSTSVREAAVDLVGKFVLSRPELIDKYYDMLSARILDTGVSVRKRVIKILKDICMECPDFPKIPEICVKMIRRVNDEEGIRKLVMEVFQNMWFTPVKERPTLDSESLLRKVMNITDVVAASKDMGLEWFEQLLISLFKPKEDKDDSTKMQTEPPRALLTACKQIVDCLIENVLRLEETNLDSEKSEKKGSSQRLVACLTTLYLFAKIRPRLLVNHAITLQPYLSLKCQTQGDYQIISSVAHTLELVVPLMEHPSETFLAQLEEDSVKLILQHDRSVVASCLSCLGSVVNNVTRNYKLIRDCFKKYYGHLTEYKSFYEKDPTNPMLIKCRPFFRRALFTVGLLLRHFNFMDPEVIEGLADNIKDKVFETLSYFVHLDNDDIRHFTLSAIGSLCIRHYEFMMLPELKELYHHLLTSEYALVHMRIQVLNNIEVYLQEEEKRMIKQDLEWAKLSKQENLKEMGDVSSGMASTVIQLYIKEILESFLHVNVSVRHAALKVIQLILAQGLVHPVQIVPYLICMSTDCEKVVSHSADKQLQDIEKKYPGFIHMKSQFGIKLSYRLQKLLQNDITVRGMRTKEGEFPGALNGFLYTILRNTKQQRRAIVLSFLKHFDETAKTSLSQMLYLADNLAYFTYQVQDEPLFIIHHIDIIISMSGTNLLQSFKEALLPKENSAGQSGHSKHTVQQTAQSIGQPTGQQTEQSMGQSTGQPMGQPAGQTVIGPDGQPKSDQLLSALEDEEDDEEDEEALLARLPGDTTLLREYITASQGFLLLLTLRQHLKDLYGFSDAKIGQYSPSEAAKVYEKAVNRKNNLLFEPKATLQRLREGMTNINEELDANGRKKLVKEYLDFKQLMLKFDPEEPDDDGGNDAADTSGKHSAENPQAARIPLHPKADGGKTIADGTVVGDTAASVIAAGQQQFQLPQSNLTAPMEYPNNSVNSLPVMVATVTTTVAATPMTTTVAATPAMTTVAATTPRVPKLTIHAHPDARESHRKRAHKTDKSVRKHKKKKRRRISDSSDSGEDYSDPDFLVAAVFSVHERAAKPPE